MPPSLLIHIKLVIGNTWQMGCEKEPLGFCTLPSTTEAILRGCPASMHHRTSDVVFSFYYSCIIGSLRRFNKWTGFAYFEVLRGIHNSACTGLHSEDRLIDLITTVNLSQTSGALWCLRWINFLRLCASLSAFMWAVFSSWKRKQYHSRFIFHADEDFWTRQSLEKVPFVVCSDGSQSSVLSCIITGMSVLSVCLYCDLLEAANVPTVQMLAVS